MPFWPSFEPWAKLTPVHVRNQQAADPPRRRLLADGRLVERRNADKELGEKQQQSRQEEPGKRGEQQ
jgi:hypothetical protein